MAFYQYIIILNLIFIIDVSCHIYKYPDRAQNGPAFPDQIVTSPGHDLRIELLKKVTDAQRCILKLPDFSKHDLKTSTERFESWGNGCGVKIKNVSKKEEGYWRLISENDSSHIEGVFSVVFKEIEAKIVENIGINVFNESKPAMVNVSDANTSYCHLSQKDTLKNFMVYGKCEMELNRVSENNDGVWNVHLGIPGKVEEENGQTLVKIYTEAIDVGHQIGSENVAHLYCNLRDSERKLNFCRFERVSDGKGFNLIDGIGKGRYSYYGKGLLHNECGLNIENPQDEDYGNWKCSLGITDDEHQPTVIQRVMMVNKRTSRIVQTSSSVTQIIGSNEKELRVKCMAKVSLKYCTFTHPNGTEFPLYFPKNASETDSSYWYSKEGLETGQCEIVLRKASFDDSGVWTCHMGNAYTIGKESTDTVEVRIGGEIAAVETAIVAKIGSPVIIHCVSAGGNFPLKYCRFESPLGRFNIDGSAKTEQPLLEHFYFPPNASLSRGDCALGIKSLSYDHIGNWKCVAMIDDRESSDDIILISAGGNLSAASTAGITIGIVALFVTVGVMGLFMWRRRRLQSRDRLQESRSPSARPTVEGQLPSSSFTGRTSGDSETSETQFAMRPVTIYGPSGGANL